MSNEWPVPEGLSSRGQTAARIIVDFLTEHGRTDHGGGGKFYLVG